MSQKLTTVETPKQIDSIARVLSSGLSCRKLFDTDSVTPAAPNPSNAVEIMRNPKWYQRDTDSTLVRESSSKRVAKDMMNIPDR
jgi:hypothetical protein